MPYYYYWLSLSSLEGMYLNIDNPNCKDSFLRDFLCKNNYNKIFKVQKFQQLVKMTGQSFFLPVYSKFYQI